MLFGFWKGAFFGDNYMHYEYGEAPHSSTHTGMPVGLTCEITEHGFKVWSSDHWKRVVLTNMSSLIIAEKVAMANG